MTGSSRWGGIVSAALFLLLARTSAAQVKVDGLTATLSGTVSAGYSADYSNTSGSDHNWTIGGAANLAGSYYTPNFLTYNASFYLNQSRANSNFQSTSDASGVNLSANLFGGSRFPGSVSYSKAYNAEGNYAIPGLANYVTHGNSDTFGVNWGENLPDVPSFSIGYQRGASQYTVYGTNDNGTNAFHSLNLHSSYSLAGFNMGAYYTDGAGNSRIPEILTVEQIAETNSSNSGYGFNVSRALPVHGSFATTYSHSEYGTDFQGTSSSGTINTVNTSAAVHPTSRFAVTGNVNYSDNLAGQLIQAIQGAGGVIPASISNEKSDSLDLMILASYSFEDHLQAQGFAERRTQDFLGQTYGVGSYGGGATFSHKLLGGNLNASTSVTDNTSDNSNANNLGFSANANYASKILGWNVNGAFGYSQNVQTLLITYLNSIFNYSANARRRWGKFSLSFGGGEARTGLTQNPGTTSSSQSFNASMGYSQYLTATGSYSRSSGQALATGAGLVPVPVPSPILPSGLVSLYGGDSYSFSLSSSPLRNLIVTSSYAKSSSNTTSDLTTSKNNNDQFNAFIQYQFRKLSATSGYSRLGQGFSDSGSPAEVVSSFYIGVSRWFNFF